MHWSGTGSGLGGLEAGPNGMRLSSSSLKLSSTLAFRTRVLRIGFDLDFSSSSGSSSSNLWLSSGPPRIFLGTHRGTVFTSIFLPSFFCSDYYHNSRHHYHVCKYDRLRTFSIKMFLIKKLKKVTFQKKHEDWRSFSFIFKVFSLVNKVFDNQAKLVLLQTMQHEE